MRLMHNEQLNIHSVIQCYQLTNTRDGQRFGTRYQSFQVICSVLERNNITLRLAFANKKVPQEFEMFAITTLCNILTSNQRNKTKRFFRTICRLVLVNFFQNSFSDLRDFFYIIRKNKLNENQILPCKYRILTGNL